MGQNGTTTHLEANPGAKAWAATLDAGRYFARAEWLWAWLAGGFAALLANGLGRAGLPFIGWSLACVMASSAIAVLIIQTRKTGLDINHSLYLRRGDHLFVKVSGHWLDLGKVADNLYFDPDGRVVVGETITWAPPPMTT